MKPSKFWNSYSSAIELLKVIDFYKDDCPHKTSGYSKGCPSYSRSGNYRQIYEGLVDNLDYDIVLYDDSLFQLSLENKESRMMFIQNPQLFVSFESFLSENKILNENGDYNELKELFLEDYQQYLSEVGVNKGAVYLRYDEDLNGRKIGCHSYAHLHVGLNNNIRIPIGLELTPLAFVLFVIRNVYYDKWVDMVSKNLIDRKYINFKSKCSVLDDKLWNDEERKALFIS